MSNPWVIAAPSQTPLVEVAAFVAAVQAEFGSHSDVKVHDDGPMDVEVVVQRPGEAPFSITRSRDGLSVSADGTPTQNAEVAAWVRGLLPGNFPRVIAFDMGWTGHADLPAGVTADEVLLGWVDHSVPGWNAGDPDLS